MLWCGGCGRYGRYRKSRWVRERSACRRRRRCRCRRRRRARYTMTIPFRSRSRSRIRSFHSRSLHPRPRMTQRRFTRHNVLRGHIRRRSWTWTCWRCRSALSTPQTQSSVVKVCSLVIQHIRRSRIGIPEISRDIRFFDRVDLVVVEEVPSTPSFHDTDVVSMMRPAIPDVIH